MALVSPESKAFKPGRFNENYKFNSKDIRFTTKDDILYAFSLGTPTEDILPLWQVAGFKIECK